MWTILCYICYIVYANAQYTPAVIQIQPGPQPQTVCITSPTSNLINSCTPIGYLNSATGVFTPVSSNPTFNLTGYIYGNGASAATASPTIPASAVQGLNGNAILQDTNTWTNANTFAVPPIFTGLSGPLVGNGSSAITAGTFSGNTTKFAVVSGSLVSGNCLKADSNLNIVDVGSPCGTATGTVGSSTANNLAYYAVTGSNITGLSSANNGTLVTSNTGVPSISSTLPSAVQLNITSLGTVTAGSFPAANLSGSTLAAGVTASSLTSFGASAAIPAANLTGTTLASNVVNSSLNTSECTSAFYAGFVGDGTTDNLAKWNSFVSAAGSNSICIAWQTGLTYKFSGALTATLTGSQYFVWRGNYANFLFPASNGLTLTYVQGLGKEQFPITRIENGVWLTSSAATYTAITINGGMTATGIPRQTVLQNNHYHGSDFGSSYSWLVGRSIQNASNVTLRDEYMAQNYTGTGVVFNGTSSSATPSMINVDGENDFQLATGFSATGYFQGVNIQHSNYTGVGTGVSCNATSAEYQCDVTGTQISSFHSAISLTNINNSHIANNTLTTGIYNGTISADAQIKLVSSPNTIIVGNTQLGSNAGDGTYPKGVTVDINSGNLIYLGDYNTTFNSNNLVVASSQGVVNVANRFDVLQTNGSASPLLNLNLPGNFYLDNGSGTTASLTFAGHLQPVNNASPTVTSCGAGASVSGSDTSGTITTGSGATACTFTYAVAHTTTSFCTVAPHSNLWALIYTPVLSGISLSTVTASVTYDYICSGV